MEEPLEQICNSISGPWEPIDCSYSIYDRYGELRTSKDIKIVYSPNQTYSKEIAEQLVFNESMDFIRMEWRIKREIKDKIGMWYLYLTYNNSFPTVTDRMHIHEIELWATTYAKNQSHHPNIGIRPYLVLILELKDIWRQLKALFGLN